MECANGYVAFQKSCYQLSDTKAARLQAAAACMPGHLVDIKSHEEQSFLIDLLEEGEAEGVWTGLRKLLVWSNLSPIVEESWQPIILNGEQNRACFRLSKVGTHFKWSGTSCDELSKSICEYQGMHV